MNGYDHSYISMPVYHSWGFPGGSVVKNPPAHAGDLGSIPGSGRSPGDGNGNPLQDSRLENPTDRGIWQGTVQRVTEVSEVTEHACMSKYFTVLKLMLDG